MRWGTIHPDLCDIILLLVYLYVVFAIILS